MKHVHPAVKALIKGLIPDISEHCLELDRAHRALQPPCSDGLPRDIIVKPNFFSVKEEVMIRSRMADTLTTQGYTVQVFADFSPYTVQKQRSLKPLLQVLQQKEITYIWSFPLRLYFAYRNKGFGFLSFVEGERLLLHLGLISQELQPPPLNKGPPRHRNIHLQQVPCNPPGWRNTPRGPRSPYHQDITAQYIKPWHWFMSFFPHLDWVFTPFPLY